MRKSILFTSFLFCVFLLQGQAIDNITEGDVFVISEPTGSAYAAIDFPRRNIIIKRGAIADFNALIGKKVFVDQLETDEEGRITVTLKRADGLNFFRFFPKVNADLARAIESKELKTVRL